MNPTNGWRLRKWSGWHCCWSLSALRSIWLEGFSERTGEAIMTPEQWEKVEQLYNAAFELKPEDRVAFLKQTCGEDQLLRQEVEALLVAEGQAGNFLTSDMRDVVLAKALEKSLSLIGKKLGPYQVLALVGAGGMGEVYRARDARLSRDVAVKVLP